MTLRLISNTRASEPGTMTSLTASLGTLTYRVSPGLALVGLKVILFTVRSAFIAPRTFSECEGSRLGGTAMVYNVFSKLICILVMAEGIDPTDPTTETTPLIPDDTGDDDDIDLSKFDIHGNPIDPDPETTQPFEPGGASTPYPEGEEYEMTRLPQEQSGGGKTIPEAPEVTDFVDKPTLLEMSREQIKARFPKVDLSKIPLGLGTKKGLVGKVVALGKRGGEVSIFREDGNITKAFEDQFGSFLGSPAENIIAEDNTALQDTQRRIDEAQQLEARLNAQAEKQEQETQKRQRLETQYEQVTQRIGNMVNEGGTEMERQMEIDRLKREKVKLTRDIDAAKKQEKEYAKTAKEQDKVAKEVERLKRQYENQRQKRDTTEATLNRTKPLDELEREREELKRKIEEDRLIMNDKDATSRERMTAGERFSENTDELARLDPQIQEREQELPLRERVKNIFKKYGWTLQAVALAVGIVLSALALAATNGLKAGTKAIGNGLKTIGQKLGSLLPGLIGSIVSYIFKAAGSVLSFLAEHAWLLILAVVAFFMERMLKRRRR